ncbi:MAG: TonB-dependent receptor, partial [Candidatus Eremiobacteraeota bacterium]|nr:TonB-dependent receptor [Candidatus Eremiobacteraeota bacterium]
SPFDAVKLEYSTFWGTSSLGARIYQTAMSQSEALPSRGLYVPQSGGIRSGIASDYTHVQSEKHTLQFGFKYEFAAPYGELDNYVDYEGALDGQYQNIGGSIINLGKYTHDIFADFSTQCNSGAPPGPPAEQCGYLTHFFPQNAVPQLPVESEVPTAKQQVYGLYGQDTYTPTSRLKVLVGLRLDGYNFLIPNDPQNPPTTIGLEHQHELEPHLGAAYQLDANDVVRVNYGRTLAIPLPTFLGLNINRAAFAAFANIPSFDSVTGKPAVYCGPAQPTVLYGNTYYLGNQLCANYADQLYWLIRNARFFGQSQITYPLRGATFNNFDASYEHEFSNGVALKFTPFYRRGYDVVEASQTLLGIDPNTGAEQLSPLVYSNLGMQKATGFEFYLTTPHPSTGWSGQWSITYINQIGNDPPGDYLPTASVQLGLLYHSSSVPPLQSTLGLTYKNKNGLNINPIFHFRSGYPYGVGVYQAYTINNQPFYIPNTNVLYPGVFSTQLAAALTNPQFPGSITGPNITAIRGVDAITSGPGTLYSTPALTTDITISIQKAVTYGILITNLTNVTAGLPAPNYAINCQLVSAGQCAAFGTPNVQDQYHHTPVLFGSASGPYIVYPTQQPMQVRAFIQMSF